MTNNNSQSIVQFEVGQSYVNALGKTLTVARRTEKSIWDCDGNRFLVHSFSKNYVGDRVETIGDYFRGTNKFSASNRVNGL